MSSDLPGADQVQNANNQGQSAINNFDPTSVANTQRGQFTDLFNTQLGSGPRNAGDYFSAFSSQVAKNPQLQDLYTRANQNYNVQPLAQKAAYLNTEVANMPIEQQNLMRGFDASQEQVNNAVNYNLSRLSPQASMATSQAQAAQNLANQEVGYGLQQNQFNLLPIQSYGTFLNDALARQSTGFTQAAQDQFAGLQAKMQSGVQLSQSEMQQLAALQESKNSYDAAIAQANASQNVARITSANQILSPGQIYYNPYSGQTYNPYRVR